MILSESLNEACCQQNSSYKEHNLAWIFRLKSHIMITWKISNYIYIYIYILNAMAKEKS